MKKIYIFLFISVLVLCLTGCNNDNKLPKNGLNQQELWDYLDNYSRFLSVWGPEDSALMFKNDKDIVFDNSVYYGEGFDYNFTELKSFTYEGNNIYKLEYQNLYPDFFESSIFYIEIIPEFENKIRFGMYYDGKLEYVDLFGDVGFSKEQLIAEFAKHEYWLEAHNEMYGLYYFNVFDNDKFNLGITNSGFEFSGTISKIDYLGYMYYNIIVDYPGFEGDDMYEPYDPYSIEYITYYNPNFEKLLIHINDEMVGFAPEVNLSSDELLTILNKYDKWIQIDDEIYAGYFIIAHDKDKLDLGLSNSGFWISGTITEIRFSNHMSYTVVVSYPGYAGDEITDPYDPYTMEYYFYYNPDGEVLMIQLDGDSIEFAPDTGLTAEELLNALSNYEIWYEYKDDHIGYFLKVYEDKFELGLMDTEYGITGTISNVKYCGEYLYEITVDYPGFEGNEMQDPYDPYTLTHQLYFVTRNERLVMIINHEFVDFSPAYN